MTTSVTLDDEKTYPTHAKVGIVLSVILLSLMTWFGPPASLNSAAWYTAMIATLMAIFWVTEAIPLPITALIPLVAFPLLGINNFTNTASSYAHPIIFLFLGGFILALAIQRWNLHKRIALTIIHHLSTEPKTILLGFMIPSAFLSMWISNSATTLMMLPMALSVLSLLKDHHMDEAQHKRFATALLLTLAYSATIGGMGTLIGTPPTAFLAAYAASALNIEIGFAQWMLMGVPLVVVSLPMLYLLITRVLFVMPQQTACDRTAKHIKEELAQLGKASSAERTLILILILVATLWITRPIMQQVIPGLSDAGIAIFGVLLLFIVPYHPKRIAFLMNWDFAKQLPWSILILFGGGLSLAGAFTYTGLAEWLGNSVIFLQHWPLFLLLIAITTMVLFLTELTSNTATSATFIPILASIAIGLHYHPLLFIIPAAFAANCAFMLPVATPPNAIIYGSHYININDMVRTGLFLNIIFVILIPPLVYWLGPYVFDILP